METNFLLHETDHFRIEHSKECLIPGYLMLFSKSSAESFHELSDAALSEFTPLIKIIYAAIDSVIQPERIYCASFGEVLRTVHFHFFPRTTWMDHAFRKHHPECVETLNAPVVFEWARQFYKTHPVPNEAGDLNTFIKRLKTVCKP